MTGLFSRKPRGGVLALLIVAAALLCTPIACRQTKDANDKTGKASDGDRPDDAHCTSLADSALDMLAPDRLGISARGETAISVLNQWGDRCGNLSAEKIQLKPDVEKFLKAALGDKALAQLSGSHFTQRDGRHIRDCLLLRRQTEFLTRPGRDLDRVMHIFEYVMRNVALVDETTPLSPFQILLFGRGSARDRAWVFAGLLRQLRIDAVILRPAVRKPKNNPAKDTSSADKPDHRWLIGVLLDGGVYLFDPRLGTAVPSAAEKINAEKTNGIRSLHVRRPATLAGVQADGTLLTSLSFGKKFPYPLQADDLRSPAVELIADAGFWSPRMKQLQASLTGDRTVIVYDGLARSEASPGLLSRVRKFGGGKWSPQNVGLWTYPERTLARITNLNDRQAGRLRILRAPFSVPYEQVRTRQGGVAMQPEYLQLKTRISHMLGQYPDAAKSYLFVRTHADFPVGSNVPPEIRRYHIRAGEDATYWGGLCQMEQGDYQSAINTFIAYVKRYGQRAVWLSPARGLLAECFARQKDYDRAIRSIENIPDDDLLKPAYQFMIRRLTSLKAKSSKSQK